MTPRQQAYQHMAQGAAFFKKGGELHAQAYEHMRAAKQILDGSPDSEAGDWSCPCHGEGPKAFEAHNLPTEQEQPRRDSLLARLRGIAAGEPDPGALMLSESACEVCLQPLGDKPPVSVVDIHQGAIGPVRWRHENCDSAVDPRL